MQGNLYRILHIQGMMSKNFSSTLINNSKNSYNQKLTLKEVSYFSFCKYFNKALKHHTFQKF